MATTITGYSDDVINLDGDLYDELYPPADTDDDQGALLACSNGVLLRIRYDTDGIWRITPLAGADRVQITLCPDPLGEEHYTDTAVITDPLTWALCGTQLSKPINKD